KVNTDGNWDDEKSLGALIDKYISKLEFRQIKTKDSKKAIKEKMGYNRRIAFQAQAEAIIEHIVNNMEIKGITSSGTVKALNTKLTLTQSNDGAGHVK
ncbi:MAG: hypothetical protein GY757_43120, partial [bacterium]|nr:hypothetical protein [bacterium]